MKFKKGDFIYDTHNGKTYVFKKKCKPEFKGFCVVETARMGDTLSWIADSIEASDEQIASFIAERMTK